MSFRRSPFPEVLENLLTAVTRGVAAEPHPFPPGNGEGPPRHALRRPPVARVVSVRGSLGGEPHLFVAERDFRLAEGSSIEWLEGGDRPDAGTLFQVCYYPRGAEPDLTDVQTGSVVRTLCESVALELARLSAQLQAVYESGFIDLAGGSSLDKVVALLGIERVRAGRPAGDIELTRAESSRGAITVPAGTRVLTADGAIEYETTATVTLAVGQRSVRVVARDLEPNDALPADSLTVLPVPIAGIVRVTNPAPTALSGRDEADEELRTRAKSFLYGSERATLGALRHAVSRQGIRAEVLETAPGRVEVVPQAEHLDPELRERVIRAIEEARPAGVRVELRAARPPRKVHLSFLLTTAEGLLLEDLRRAQREVRAKVGEYFERLPSSEDGSVNRLVGLVLSVAEVEDVRLLEAAWEVDGVREPLAVADGTLPVGGHPTALGDLQIVDPALPTLVRAVVTFAEGEAPPDPPSVRAALEGALGTLSAAGGAPVPSGLDAAALEREQERRRATWEKLALAVPLPGKPGVALEEQEEAADAGAPLEAPDLGPYALEVVMAEQSGLAARLAGPGDAYALSAFERLELDSVEVEEVAGG